ncbi:NAD(+)--rifampin ADP-ribosyltransferase [Lysobacter soli]|uniref:NAD(+)--rifampin ADP-ribosyltransferase n=1 Tax=Lysobacter soli TaxID=453783 RepID=UPI0018DBBD45|nr:NAD(+)--rifampin ADP-ribosyltransferase [Lysobacter soli]
MGDSTTYYHGTKADLAIGALIEPGRTSNYGKRAPAKFVYLSATLDAAIWGAELAVGEGRGHVYIVEPTGPIEDDPNLTDKRFPGNPTKSYRSAHPFRVVGEIIGWEGHPPERLEEMRAHLETLRLAGVEAIEE